MAERLMVIDVYSLANRAFFALPPLTTSSGQPTNAVYGMAMMLLKLLDESKPDYFIAAADAGVPTFRHQEFQAYKGQRLKMEDSLRSQIPLVKELLTILGITTLERPGYEADDLIGSIAKQAAKKGLTVEIITGDRDAFQLVEPGINVLYTRKGITELDRVDPDYIHNRYQLQPEQLIDLKGLMGDVSDNIPGIPGFGEKTALKYLQLYQTIDRIYEHVEEIARQRDRELLKQYREQVYLSRKLAKIITDLDLEVSFTDCCQHRHYDRERLLDFSRQYEFKSLVKKLAGEAVEIEPSLRPRAELEYQVKTLTAEELNLAVDGITKQKAFAFQFITSNCNRSEVVWLGLGLSDFANHWYISLKDLAVLPEAIKGLFEDTGVLKVGHDLKKQIQLAGVKGFQINGPIEDTLIAGYLVNAGIGGLELEELAETYLQKTIPFWTNERGTKFSVFSLPAELPEEVLAKISGGRLAALSQLRQSFAKLLQESEGLAALYREVELPLIRVLAAMEHTGIKVNPQVLREFGEKLKARQLELEADIYSLAGQEFNISSPKQLGSVLFDKLGLTAPKKTKTGYSTDAETLEILSDQHPVIPKILEYRQNVKLQTTYIDSLIALINPKTGRVHTTFNQAVTTTGRLSSTEPNLQNIPIRTDEGKMIRQAFITENEDHLLLAADYSQIELRVMAHFSEDHGFKEAFLKGEDIHKFTAAAVNGVEVSQVTKEMRDRAKAVNFGIIYGISGFGLAKNIGATRKEADLFIETFFIKYPGVQNYVAKLIETARESGAARTLLGRIRKLPDLYSRNFTLRSFAERMARNTPIQGTAADIIKVAMIKLGQVLTARPELGKLILQVHDELVFEVAKDKWRELARIVKQEMEEAVKLSVPLTVEIKTGPNWGEMSPVTLEE